MVADRADRGPFETEDDARMTPAVRVVYQAYDHGQGTGDLSGAPLILAACEEAGVGTGAYDARIIAWLGNWEPAMCAVIAGLIIRAREAGKTAANEGAVTEWALSYIHRPSLSGRPARRVVQPYPDEAMAREAVAAIVAEAPGDEPRLMRREVGPWKEAGDAQVPE
jgi:hypothetical protein